MLSIVNVRNSTVFILQRVFALLVVAGLICILPIAQPKVHAQTSEKTADTKASPALPATDEEIEASIANLQKLLDETDPKLLKARKDIDAAAPGQPGTDIDEPARRARMLQKMISAYRVNIDALKTLKETRKASAVLATETNEWKPSDKYTINDVDDLHNAIHTVELKIRESEVKQSITQDDLRQAVSLVETAQTNLGKAGEQGESAKTDYDKAVVGLLLGLAKLQGDTARVEKSAFETKQLVLQEVMALHKQNLAFLERKLQTATEKMVFSQEDLQARLDAIEAERSSARKEMDKAVKADGPAQEALQAARQALEQAQQPTPDGAEPDPKEIERLQLVLDAKTAEAETIKEVIEGLDLLFTMFDAKQLIWNSRYRLYSAPDKIKFKAVLGLIDSLNAKDLDYQFHFESKKKLAQDLIMRLQDRMTTSDWNNQQRELAKRMLKAYQDRAKLAERALAQLDEITRLLEHWRAEVEWQRSEIPILERIKKFFAAISNEVGTIWNYELFSVEDTFIIDGKPITAQRPITVSKVIRALLILILGLWLGSLLGRRVQSLSMKHLKIERRIAELVEKGFRVVIIILVVIIALVTVKIPLTVFAFLGGALAIGVGFGAQNLINNFISGIILLFERPIKVGDIVEVDGTRGRVVTIGGRCSQVRRFDGIDILVPNSVFLEKNVVNWTLTDEVVRLSVTVGVAYGSPTQQVSDIIAKSVDEHEKILKTPKPIVLFEDFGDNALIFTVYFWTEVSPWMDFRIVASELRHMLNKYLDEAGITIAFPQRDVHLDSVKPIQVQISDSKPPDQSEG